MWFSLNLSEIGFNWPMASRVLISMTVPGGHGDDHQRNANYRVLGLSLDYCCSSEPSFSSIAVSISLWNTVNVTSFLICFYFLLCLLFPAVVLKQFRYGALIDFYTYVRDVPHIYVSLWIDVCNVSWSLYSQLHFLFTLGEVKVTWNLW